MTSDLCHHTDRKYEDTSVPDCAMPLPVFRHPVLVGSAVPPVTQWHHYRKTMCFTVNFVQLMLNEMRTIIN